MSPFDSKKVTSFSDLLFQIKEVKKNQSLKNRSKSAWGVIFKWIFGELLCFFTIMVGNPD